MRIGTATDVKQLLRTTKQHVYELARRKQIPGAFKLGDRQIRFDLDAIEDWIRNGGSVENASKSITSYVHDA